MEVFSKRLRELRTQKGKQQADMAALLEVSPQSYSTYENGREPNYDLLIRLSKYFGVSLDYLLGASEYRTLENKSIGQQIGLSEQALENLKGIVYDLKCYRAGGDDEEDKVKNREAYLLLANFLLGNHGGFFALSLYFREYIDTIREIGGETDVLSLTDAFDSFVASQCVDQDNVKVVGKGDYALFMLYSLSKKFEEIVKDSATRAIGSPPATPEE